MFSRKFHTFKVIRKGTSYYNYSFPMCCPTDVVEINHKRESYINPFAKGASVIEPQLPIFLNVANILKSSSVSGHPDKMLIAFSKSVRSDKAINEQYLGQSDNILKHLM